MKLIKYIAQTAWTPITMIFLLWLLFDGVAIEVSKVITNSVLKFYEFFARRNRDTCVFSSFAGMGKFTFVLLMLRR